MPRATKEMLKLDAWLSARETAGIRATPLQREGTAVRRARNAQKARAVERVLRWRGKARNRRKLRRYRKLFMRAQRVGRKAALVNDLQPKR